MRRLLITTLALVFSTGADLAADKEHKKSDKQRSEVTKKEPWLSITISDNERELLRKDKAQLDAAEAPKGKKLPPGLAKKQARGGKLPPGWEKKLAKGEVMAPEVYAAATPLPKDVAKKLPPQPDGVITVKIEGKVVRLIEATKVILDVFDL